MQTGKNALQISAMLSVPALGKLLLCSGAEPQPLASSLQKMEQAARVEPLRIPESQKNMFIVEPFTGKKMAKLFMTHPPTEDRIARLNRIGRKDS